MLKSCILNSNGSLSIDDANGSSLLKLHFSEIDRSNLFSGISILKPYCPRIRSLVSGSTNFDEDSLNVLTTFAISEILQLEELNLSNCNLSIFALSKLCNFLNLSISGFCPLKKLFLVRCRMGTLFCDQLLDSLVANNVLECLHISGNMMGDDCASKLVKVLGHSTCRISSLGIGGNGLTAAGMKEICKGIRACHSLRELHVQDNSVTDEGMEAILHAARHHNQITGIYASECGLRSCVWAQHLRFLSTLATLQLSHNLIDSAGLDALCNGLLGNGSLRHLDLSHNLFGESPCLLLSRYLSQNGGMFSLSLAGNALSPVCLDSLMTAVLENDGSAMMDLDLQMIGLSAQRLRALHELAGVLGDRLRIRLDPMISSEGGDRNGDGSSGGGQGTDISTSRLTEYTERRSGSAAAVTSESTALPEATVMSALTSSFQWRLPLVAEIESCRRVDSVLEGLSLSPERATVRMPNPSRPSTAEAVAPPEEAATPVKGRGARAEAASLQTGGKRNILSVAYGPRTEIIGTIAVASKATYRRLRREVVPLLAQYLGVDKEGVNEGVDVNTNRQLRGFRMVDGEGEVVPEDDEPIRRAWEELARDDFCLQLRPAGWLSLAPVGPAGSQE